MVITDPAPTDRPSPPSDATLVQRSLDGDRTAYGELYRRHFSAIYDFVLRMTRRREEAADLSQDVFIRAMEHLDTLQRPEAFRSWVFSIAYRTTLNRLERERRSVPTDPTSTEEGLNPILAAVDDDRLDDPAERAAMAEIADLVWAAAEGLDPRTYAVVDLHLRQGLSSAEIAEALDVTKGNAYTMLNRAKARMADAITAHQLARLGTADCAELRSITAGGEPPPLTPDLRAAIDRHARSCEVCEETKRRILPPLRAMAALAATMPPAEVVAEGWERVERAWDAGGGPGSITRSARRRRRFARLAGLLAAVVALFAVSVLLAVRLGEEPTPPVSPAATPSAPTSSAAEPPEVLGAAPSGATTTVSAPATTTSQASPPNTGPSPSSTTTASDGQTATSAPPGTTVPTTSTAASADTDAVTTTTAPSPPETTTTSTTTTSTTSAPTTTASPTTTTRTTTTTTTTSTLPPNTPPSGRIERPADGAQFTADGFDRTSQTWFATVALAAAASDAEDPPDQLAIEWTSNLDGLLGRGARITATLTAPACFDNRHQITMKVTDTAGAVTSTSIVVVVEQVC